MNRTKSILLAATALGVLGLAGQAQAQTVEALGVTFLSPPAQPDASNSIFPDSHVTPTGISADGSTVVALVLPPSESPNASVQSQNANNFHVWTNGVLQTIATNNAVPPEGRGNGFSPLGISGDGSTVIGQRAAFIDRPGGAASFTRAAIWTQANGVTFLPDLSATEVASPQTAVNADGSIFAVTIRNHPYNPDGSSNPARNAPRRAYRYSIADGYQSLGSLGAAINMSVSGISGQGNVISGNAFDTASNNFDIDDDVISQSGFRWSTAAGLIRLPDLDAAPLGGTLASFSLTSAVSRDGSTIVGYSRGSDGRNQAVYWRGDAVQGLGFLPGLSTPTAFTIANAASANGSVIVGTATTTSGEYFKAWHWTAATGMQDLNVLAQNAGLNLNGFVLSEAIGISDNGQYITGSANKGPLDAFGFSQQIHGYVLSITAAPVPEPIPVVTFLTAPAGNETPDAAVVDISANGSVVAGGFGNAGIILWNGGSPTEVANARGVYTSAISGDGNTVTGELFDATRLSVVYRRATNDIRNLPDMAANEIAVYSPAVNQDGTFLAVTSAVLDLQSSCGRTYLCATANRAFRWSEAGGYENLGSLGATSRHFTAAISGDGSVIVGYADDIDVFNAATAFRWTSANGLAALPSLAAASGLPAFAQANGISRDGSTIVGRSRGTDSLFQAVYWRGSTITALGYVPGTNPANAQTDALATNGDGSIIVGTNDLSRAWRWTSATGMQDLNLIASNAGINLNGYVLTDAVGLSDDGQIIAGNAVNGEQYRGYVLSYATLPPPPTNLTTSARLIVTLTLPGVTQTSIVNQTFSTQVDALLNGSTVFTRTVGDQISGSLGVTALADARTALQVGSGLRRVVIGAPTLVSNTTTVLSSTSNTVNVASGTQVTQADVVTNGPATVVTGDLGTCATAAATNVNPTGCSLPGTAVAVNTNVINTNTFTNTINSVTPTTTTTVEQLISAKWQVSATAGNQFGTVHALAGVAAFERGDRLIGQLLGLDGASQSGAAPMARAGSPAGTANALVGGTGGLSMFGGYFGNWSRIDADASVPVANVRANTNGFVLGLQQSLGDAARIGVAVDHGTSDYTVQDAAYPETLRLRQTQVALFAGWNSGAASLDAAAAWGFGSARTSLATPTTAALADYGADSWSLGGQAGYTVARGTDASVQLVTGARHVSARLGRFVEAGGASPLAGIGTRASRTRVYAGIEGQAALDLGGVTLTPRLHARLAHDSGDVGGVADLVFAGAPNGPVLTAVGPGVGQTVAELGGTLSADVAGGINLWAGYDTALRSGAQSQAVRAGATIRW